MALEGFKGTTLEQIWENESEHRPGYRVEIWNQRLTDIQDVVLDRWKGPNVDVSDWVSQVQVTQNQAFENSEDAISSRANLTIEIEDDVEFGNTTLTIDERLFRDGTPVRIYQGDHRVDRSDWVPIFTGVCRGFPGSTSIGRGRRQVQVQAFGRAQTFQKQSIVGINWDHDTDLGDMAVDVAMIEMGLEREEIRFGTFDFRTQHKANALTQINKMAGLFQIMHTVSRKPYFNALGLLVSHDTNFDKAPIYTLDRSPVIKNILRVQQLKSLVNSVEVTGLNSEMTKVSLPEQLLNEINVTTGYFDSSFRDDIYYSQDNTRRAEDTRIVLDHKSFLGSGGSASWTEKDEFHGQLEIDTEYSPQVIGSIITVWLINEIIIFAMEQARETDNYYYYVARILKMTLMLSLLLAMTKLGRYRVFLYGRVFEFVYEENRSIATLRDVVTADIHEMKVQIPFLNTVDLSKTRARQLLRREQVKGQQYTIEMTSNPAIEVDDILVIRDPHRLPNDKWWYFYITTVEKSFQRAAPDNMMRMVVWNIMQKDSV